MSSTEIKLGNGCETYYRGAREAVAWAEGREPDGERNVTRFWYLPAELRRPFADADPATGLGPCCCRFCSPKPRESRPAGCWDTLAVGYGNDRRLTAWLVHGPGFGGARPLRRLDA